MKTIKKDELFNHLGNFLKSKGIELNEGSYSSRIQQGCNQLADVINTTQVTVSKTKVELDQALDKLRQTIHEHTAPSPPQAKNNSRATTSGKGSSAAAPKKGSRKA